MPIGAINITENPVGTVATEFQDTLVLGEDSQWGTNSYGHEIRVMGGYWSCEFDILPGKKGLGYLEEYLSNGLGRQVESYTINGKKAWEGQIIKMSLQIPGAKVGVSLKDMTNKAWVRYLTSEGGLIKRSTVFENAASQAKFGIKEQVVQGVIISQTSVADDVAEQYLNKYVNAIRARTTVATGRGGGEAIKLSVTCEGYFRTLDWRTYNLMTAHTEQNLSIQIQDVITAVGQFVSLTDIVANTQQVSQEYDRDDTAFNIITGLVRLGDASQNRHIAGMYDDRKLIYEQIRGTTLADVKYNFRIRDNKKVIVESGTGRELSPAEIRPNNYIRVADIFTGSPSPSDVTLDPQVNFIEAVTYKEPVGVTLIPDSLANVDALLSLATFGGSSPL